MRTADLLDCIVCTVVSMLHFSIITGWNRQYSDQHETHDPAVGTAQA